MPAVETKKTGPLAQFRQQMANIFKVPVEIFTTARAIKNARPGAYKDFPKPAPLKGRALDHEAWEQYGIIRQPGETDEELNRRCFDIAEAEYANQPDWRQFDNE